MPFATLDICVAQVGGFVAFCRLFVNLCCDTAYFNAQGGFLHCVESFCRRQVNTHKILCSLYRRCIPFKRKGQVAKVSSLSLCFLLAGAVGTHGIANGASVVVTYEKGKTLQNVLKTNALRPNDIKKDLRQQTKNFCVFRTQNVCLQWNFFVLQLKNKE